MRAIVQRVTECTLKIDNQIHSQIGMGLLVLLGIEDTDTELDTEWLCNKIDTLRIFGDENGMMNLDIHDIQGELMIVSQFTLHASTRKGNRPSFTKAAKPDIALPLYEKFIEMSESLLGNSVATGKFGADMAINLVNDGPVTIILDTRNKE